ncbi:SpoIIE family protein phosphatase [Streptomyces sp. NPDC093085]|uniref:SpoIIE family protein phosphatase n=1 Tax=Streptomyces sp. NPDC093085 TaxID=3155068 RepID=UPI00341DC970
MTREGTSPPGPGDRPGPPPTSTAATARVTTDLHGVVTSWNEGAQELLGYAPAETVGRPAALLLADGVPAGGVPEGVRPDGGQVRWNGPLRLRHRDGRVVEVPVLAHRQEGPGGPEGPSGPEESGGPEGSGGSRARWLLVTAVRGTEAVPEDIELARYAFDQSPTAIAVYDLTFRLRRINTAMRGVIGLTEDEVRGLRLPEIGGKPQSQELEDRMREAVATGAEVDARTVMRTGGEAEEHAWSAKMAPLRDAEGRLRGVCLTANDVTEESLARQRLLLLNNASLRIGTTLDVRRTARELTEVCVPHLADLAVVDLLEHLDTNSEPPPGPVTGPVPLRRAAHHSRAGKAPPQPGVPVGAVRIYPDYSPMAESLATGRSVVVATDDPVMLRWAVEDPRRTEFIERQGLRWMMAVPVLARGTTLGAAVLWRTARLGPFVPDDVLLAEEITARAAVCIDNARRFTREQSTSLALQQSLLPHHLPRANAVEIASRYLPASPHPGVGGDWFDVIPLSGARVALVVGDVVGHGIQASATMGRLRTAVRTLADVDLPPDELLTHLDDLVIRLSAEAGAEHTSGEVGATCLYAVYDPISRRCTLAAAGHPAPVVVTPDGRTFPVELPVGPPLGVGGLPFESVEFELPEGTVIALYTDGLLDGWERDPDEGRRVLGEVLARPAASLDATCGAVLSALPPGRGVPDDVALLLARTKVLDTARVATWDVPADPAEVATTRGYVTAQLRDWRLEDAIFATELVTSELVTNAIRHATPPIQLRLIHDMSLICEVSDSSTTVPHLRRARAFDEGGRGLLLVAQLTQRWGSRHNPTGKTIWAEQILQGEGDGDGAEGGAGNGAEGGGVRPVPPSGS